MRNAAFQSRNPSWALALNAVLLVLVAFLVLLLSFAEIDYTRYQRVAGAMTESFGRSGISDEELMPMGTSVVALDFAPERRDPSPISEAYKNATPLPPVALPAQPVQEQPEISAPPPVTPEMRRQIEAKIRETQDDAAQLAQMFTTQIAQGNMEIEASGRRIVLRIGERDAFGVDSAGIQPAYRRLMKQLGEWLATQPGLIEVSGHFDDTQIKTPAFASPWTLSAARAAVVVEALTVPPALDMRRVRMLAFAGTQPVAANDSAANRARNRRVEIVVTQPFDQTMQEWLQQLKAQDPAYYASLRIEPGGKP